MSLRRPVVVPGSLAVVSACLVSGVFFARVCPVAMASLNRVSQEYELHDLESGSEMDELSSEVSSLLFCLCVSAYPGH